MWVGWALRGGFKKVLGWEELQGGLGGWGGLWGWGWLYGGLWGWEGL